MEYNLPLFITPATLVRVKRFVDNAVSYGIDVANVYFEDQKDNVFFLLANDSDSYCVVHVSKHLYLVEFGESTSDAVTFSAISNIRHFVSWLKSENYQGCEDLEVEEVEDEAESIPWWLGLDEF